MDIGQKDRLKDKLGRCGRALGLSHKGLKMDLEEATAAMKVVWGDLRGRAEGG